MGHLGRRRPSAALVISIVALVVAASGTAVATTKLVSGDSLIKKDSLSGNRLRNGTVTGRDIKLSSLGQVPNARLAENANALGGQKASAFVPTSALLRSGLVTAGRGQTVTLGSFGPFTVSLKCNDDGGGMFDAEIDANSTSSNSEVFGFQLTAGTPQSIDDTAQSNAFSEATGPSVQDFVAAPDAYQVYLIDAVFMPGTTAPCAASLLAAKS